MSDLQSKTDEELNVMLATCLGWQPLTEAEGWAPSTCKTHMAKPDEDLIASPPKFCSSLDAVARVEAGLTENQKGDFINALCTVVESDRSRPGTAMFKAFFSTARQRTIALIQTLTL